MKFKLKTLLGCFIFLLASCNTNNTTTTSLNDFSTSTFTNSYTSNIQDETYDIKIIGINDFHGAVNNGYSSYGYYELGLNKLSTFIKNERNNNNLLLFSSGDMWQGSIESGISKGKYITETMNIMGFDAMTLGNHEFDWGQQYIQDNLELANFPYLCSNIFTSDNNLIDNVTGSTIIEKYGLKFGIIGAIEGTLNSSINQKMIEGLEFREKYNYVINESTKLQKENVDYIILLDHSGYSSISYSTNLKNMINNAKIDLVLAGHTHSQEIHSFTRSDNKTIPILNAICNGEAYSSVTISYDKNTKNITLKNYDVVSFNNDIYKNLNDDNEIINLYNDKYNVDDIKNEVLGNLNSTMYSAGSLANFASCVMYETISSSNNFSSYDVVGAVHNQARTNLQAGIITYEKLYRSFTFDNEILIVKTDKNYLEETYNKSKRFLNKDFNLNTLSYNTSYYFCGIDYVIYQDFSIDECIPTGLYIRDVIKEFIKKSVNINAYDYDY